MRLIEISLQRFKSFEAATFRVAPLTVLVGPNNAGKSTVLQSLALLAQSTDQNRLWGSGIQVDLGQDLEQLTHQPNDTPALGWTVSVRWTDVIPPHFPAGAGSPVEIRYSATAGLPNGQQRTSAEVTLQLPPGRRIVISVRSDVSDATVTADRYADSSTDLAAYTETRPNVNSGNLFQFHLAGAADPTTYDPGLAVNPNHADSHAYPVAVANHFLGIVMEALRSYTYVNASRQFTRSSLSLEQQPPVVLLQPDDIASQLAFQRRLEQRVSDAARRLFGYSVQVENRPQNQLSIIASDRPDGATSAVNMGSGFNQILWLATVLERHLMTARSTAPATTVGIEEPEVHLHPAAQRAVAQVLLEYAKSLSLIVTTHSEHVLTALLRSVLRGVISPADIAIYFVDRGHADPLPVDEHGRVEGGLRGFFEVTEEEIAEHLDLLRETSAREPEL